MGTGTGHSADSTVNGHLGVPTPRNSPLRCRKQKLHPQEDETNKSKEKGRGPVMWKSGRSKCRVQTMDAEVGDSVSVISQQVSRVEM